MIVVIVVVVVVVVIVEVMVNATTDVEIRMMQNEERKNERNRTCHDHQGRLYKAPHRRRSLAARIGHHIPAVRLPMATAKAAVSPHPGWQIS